jgi:hypothetical protein
MKSNTLAAKAKKPKVAKIKRFEKRTLPVRHVFDANERLELGNLLAAAMQTHGHVEDQMKSIVGDYKARLKTISVEGDQYAARIRDGYEMREIECIVHFNTATNERGKPIKKLGMKRIVNASTKEFVRDEPMTPADLQSEMFEKKKLEAESRAAKERSKNGTESGPEKGSPNVSGERRPDAKALNSPEIPKPGEPPASTAAKA